MDSSFGGYLRVSDRHEVYFETRGSGGMPILFLHGGPGAGVRDSDRSLFADYPGPVVFMDQRGAGRSRPANELAENTTWDLVGDIELLRSHLDIERWLVLGGSWGSTLALVYAISHPGAVAALIVHGVFLCRAREMQWFYGADGAASIFPDEYERFTAPLGSPVPDDLLAAYSEILSGRDPELRRIAVRAWARWEAVNSFLFPDEEQLAGFVNSPGAQAAAVFEARYFSNGGYMPDDFIVRNAAALAGIPCRIVQGRYDSICPMRSAWDLHRVLPRSRLEIVPRASHDSTERELRSRLKVALAETAAQFS